MKFITTKALKKIQTGLLIEALIYLSRFKPLMKNIYKIMIKINSLSNCHDHTFRKCLDFLFNFL